MDEFLGKDYVMVSEEGFEKYLEELGFSYLKRKVAANLRPTQTLVRNEDGTYKFRTRSLSIFDWEMVFTPGVEFDASKPDGGKVKALITFEGNTMIHRQAGDDGRISTHVLVFSPRETVVTTTLEGSNIVAKRIYVLC